MSRETAFQTLLGIAAAITPPGGGTWGESGRRWKDYTKATLPALWQLEGDVDYTSANHGQLTKRKQQVHWVIVHNVGKDQAAVPSSATQVFLDAVDARMINPKIGPITLNGQAYAAYIQGTARRYAGDQDGIEIVVIPLIVEFP